MRKIVFAGSLVLQVGSSVILAAGIIALGWDANSSVAVYFLETVVIGLCNLPLVIVCGLLGPALPEGKAALLVPPEKMTLSFQGKSRVSSSIFTAFFFCFHFGIFLYVQLVFITFAGNFKAGWPDASANPFGLVSIANFFKATNLNIAGIVSGFAFVRAIDALQFIARRNHRTTHALVQMLVPYRRVLIQQAAVIAGCFLFAISGLKAAIAITIIAIKIALDLMERLTGNDFRTFIQNLGKGIDSKKKRSVKTGTDIESGIRQSQEPMDFSRIKKDL